MGAWPAAADTGGFHRSVRIAFNLLVEDEATDKAAARTMARYWRLIYPGSGMIRRMWLNATRARVE